MGSEGLAFHSIGTGQEVSAQGLVAGSEMVISEPVESEGWDRKTPPYLSPPIG